MKRQIRDQSQKSRLLQSQLLKYFTFQLLQVSSFDTVAKHAEKEEAPLVPEIPKGCPEKDFILWNNSMHRDFTINRYLLFCIFLKGVELKMFCGFLMGKEGITKVITFSSVDFCGFLIQL